MKIIITGASGFIGKRLLQTARLYFGCGVTAFSSQPADGSYILYRDLPGFGLGLAERLLLQEAEVLIHAGAFTPKCRTEVNHLPGCNSNISFTKELLALPWKNLKKIIFLSTLDVYGNFEGVISEVAPTIPVSLYALSKLYGERMVEITAAERGIQSQVLRIGHVYGPGEEKYDKVIPKAIKNILAGKDVELWGDGKVLRSFIYIDDVITSILNAVKLQEDPGVINVIGGSAISIRNLLDKLVAIGNRETGIVQHELSEVQHDLVFDNSKLKRYLLPEESDFLIGLETEFRHIELLSTQLQ